MIHSAATMRKNAACTRIACAALVDADGRDDADRAHLRRHGVSVLPVAEIENLLLLPDRLPAILEMDDFSGAALESRLAEIKAAVFADAAVAQNVNEVVFRIAGAASTRS